MSKLRKINLRKAVSVYVISALMLQVFLPVVPFLGFKVNAEELDESVLSYPVSYEQTITTDELSEVQSASSYSFNSTNELNKQKQTPNRIGQNAPYVDFVNSTPSSVTLEFINPNNYVVCFEFRTDGDSTQALTTPNPNPGISDRYPHLCLTTNGSTEKVFNVNNYVEIRSVFGAERDWDFDWTLFNASNLDTPTNLRWQLPSLSCGSSTTSPTITASWDLVPNAVNYEYNVVTPQRTEDTAWSTHTNGVPMYNGVFNEGEGIYTYKVRAIDINNNYSDWSTLCTINYDITNPEPPMLVSPTNGSIVNGSSITQSWSSTDSDISHYIYESYHNEEATDLRWHEIFNVNSKTAVNVSEGIYWWRVKAVDHAGNESDWSELWKIIVNNEELNYGRVSGYKFVDDDGIYTYFGRTTTPDSVGWEINLKATDMYPHITNTNPNYNVTVLTDVNGFFDFSEVPPGAYELCEIMKPGWVQLYPKIELHECHYFPFNEADDFMFFFSNYKIPSGSIQGHKFIDLNDNGVDDDGEFGQEDAQGWTITLSPYNQSESSYNDTTLTDENGNYEFANVPVGEYLVCEILKAGWKQTYPNSSSSYLTEPKEDSDEYCYIVSILDGETVFRDFGNVEQEKKSISGTKYIFNNVYTDEHDFFIPGAGWTLILTNTETEEEWTEETDENGEFNFEVTAGTYMLCEQEHEEWYQVPINTFTTADLTTNDDYCYTIILEDENLGGFDFHNLPYSYIYVHKIVVNQNWEEINSDDIFTVNLYGEELYMTAIDEGNSDEYYLDSGEISASLNDPKIALFKVKAGLFVIEEEDYIGYHNLGCYLGEESALTRATVTTDEEDQYVIYYLGQSVDVYCINMINLVPTVELNVTPSHTTVLGTDIHVTAQGSGGDGVLSYSWICNNMHYGNNQSVILSSVGTYSCTVTVTDEDGDTANASGSYTILAASTPNPINTPTNNNQFQNQSIVVVGTNTDTQEEEQQVEDEGNILGANQTCTVRSTISGFVYEERNSNSTKDEDENGIEDVRITILTMILNEEGENEVIEVTNIRTNRDGRWETELCPGDYQVVANDDELQEGTNYIESSRSVTVEEGEDLENVNFAVQGEFELVTQDTPFNWWILVLVVLIAVGLIGGGLLYNRNRSDAAIA